MSDTAIFGLSTSGVGVVGQSTSNDGVVGRSTTSGKSGVWGTGTAAVGVTGMSSGSDGVVGVSTSADSGHAGIHGRNTGSGPAVFSEGSLYLTGSFIGNMGLIGGAPFPRPAYDSGWQQIPEHSCPIEIGMHHHFHHSVYLDPGLPVDQYDNQKFVIDLQTQDFNRMTTNLGVGSQEENKQVYYWINNNNSIGVHVEDCAVDVQYVRVRIWVYR